MNLPDGCRSCYEQDSSRCSCIEVTAQVILLWLQFPRIDPDHPDRARRDIDHRDAHRLNVERHAFCCLYRPAVLLAVVRHADLVLSPLLYRNGVAARPVSGVSFDGALKSAARARAANTRPRCQSPTAISRPLSSKVTLKLPASDPLVSSNCTPLR